MTLADFFKFKAVRFAIVGMVSNGTLFLGYLYLTAMGLEIKLAMSVLYAIGVMQGFVLNKKWTFSHNGYWVRTFVSYALLYALGYVANLMILYALVDALHLPHAPVQGLAMVALAAFFFFSQRLFIFAGKSDQ